MSVKLNYNLDDIKDFSLTPGKYLAKVVKVEQGLSAKKKPMLTWTWKLLSGPNKGSETKSWTSLVENALGNLKNHLVALNFHGVVRTNSAALIGRKAILILGETISADKDGNERTFVNVIGLKPIKKVEAEEEPEEEDDSDDEDDDSADEGEDEDEDDNVDDDDDDEDDDDEDEEPASKSHKSSKPVKKVLSKKKCKIPF
jgi:hypothetical protein